MVPLFFEGVTLPLYFFDIRRGEHTDGDAVVLNCQVTTPRWLTAVASFAS
jgi:hypothetical protein